MDGTVVGIGDWCDALGEIFVDDRDRKALNANLTELHEGYLASIARLSNYFAVTFDIPKQEVEGAVRDFFANRLTGRLEEKFNG